MLKILKDDKKLWTQMILSISCSDMKRVFVKWIDIVFKGGAFGGEVNAVSVHVADLKTL